MKPRYLFVLAISIVLAFSNAAVAGSKKKPTPASRTIARVTADSITIKDENATKTPTITQFTEVNVNGRKATAAELKPGMTVSVTLGTDPSKASRIIATGK
jgi:hypothetical protein